MRACVDAGLAADAAFWKDHGMGISGTAIFVEPELFEFGARQCANVRRRRRLLVAPHEKAERAGRIAREHYKADTKDRSRDRRPAQQREAAVRRRFTAAERLEPNEQSEHNEADKYVENLHFSPACLISAATASLRRFSDPSERNSLQRAALYGCC